MASSWLGLGWTASPVIQSEQIEAHRAAIAQLLASGHAYRLLLSEGADSSRCARSTGRTQTHRHGHNNAHRDLSAAPAGQPLPPKAARR